MGVGMNRAISAVWITVIVFLALVVWSPRAQGQSFTCTMVLGFSQTNQWYTSSTFESIVGTTTWELKYEGGASIDHFGDPDDTVWGATTVSPCVSGAATPDRIVLNVSGDYSPDIEYWASAMTQAVTVIRQKYPSVQQVILQPVVGGPAGFSQCVDPATDEIVRASYNAPYIAQAIQVIANSDVLVGPNAEVAVCSDYADQIGHLLDSTVFDYVGTYLGNWYTGAPPPPTATPTSSIPTNTPTPTPPTAPTDTPTPTPTPTPTVTPTPVPAYQRRFDNGSASDFTSGGVTWSADAAYTAGGCGYVGGSPFSSTVPIAGTTLDTLYYTTRIDLSAFEYKCDVPNGQFHIVLNFAEIVPNNYSAGRRVFNVAIEGQNVLVNYDVYSDVGPATATAKTFDIEVIDGQLNMVFTAVAGRAMVAAMEFSNISLATPTPPPPPTATPTPTVTPTPTPTPGNTPTPIPCRVWVSINEGPGQWATCDGTH